MLAVLDDSVSQELADAETLLTAHTRIELEGDLFAFVRAGWSVIESRPLVPTWHIEELCRVLEGVTRGDYDRVIVNIPPGTLKSLIINVFWPAWMWARAPRTRVLSASYGQTLSTRDNLKVRDIVQSPWFRGLWDVRLMEDQNTKTRFNTNRGGWRVGTSVGGPGTGEHPHYIIIDDPITAQQALSAAERQACIDWYTQTVSTRGMTSKVKVVVVMQRLHQDDLSGYLLSKGGWEHVCFPMRYEACACTPDETCALHKIDKSWAPDPRDRRTTAGELLVPEALMSAADVQKREVDLGEYGTAGQFQQRPAPEGGGLVKRGWFKYAPASPAVARRVRGWDTAGTEGGGDYTAGVRIAEEISVRRENNRTIQEATGRFFIEHAVREQLSPQGVDALILSTAHSDGKSCGVREEKEGGSAGKAVIEARARTLKGFNYSGVAISGSKVVRSKPFRSQIEAGNVSIVKTGDAARDAWIEPYIAELCAFPTAAHDDQVDGSSCAFNAVLLEPVEQKVDCTW